MENASTRSTNPQSYAMKGGEGPHSYSKNSTIQRNAIEEAKKLIQEAISKNFDPKIFAGDPVRTCCIADLGCSTGPNTFLAMQGIVEAIEFQFHSMGLAAQIPDFQVFFNDQVSNDFNTLFRTLPASRKYFAAAAPGSFHGCLFPRETLYFVHSSAALHWLSEVPKEITDRNSAAWNKGRIYCENSPKEVSDAYAAQQKKDLENFMHARTQELVSNGLMILRLIAAPDVILDLDTKPGEHLELLGSCLLDMTKEGLVSEDKVDSFNLPIFYSRVKDVMAILEANECFSVEWMQAQSLENILGDHLTAEIGASACRAALEELLEKHFGKGIIEELFNRFAKKLLEFKHFLNPQKQGIVQLVVILKRKPREV